MDKTLKARLPTVALPIVIAILLALLHGLTAEASLAAKREFDRRGLTQFLSEDDYDNDLLFDTYLLSPGSGGDRLINLHLLNLERDRLAYIARRDGEAVAVAVPTTADDGFNGRVDLLVAIDMYGRISAARVIEDVETHSLYGVVDIIESKWMDLFAGNGMRDIQRLSWQPITAENEYDQFVGASVTPKSVANQIYDALVFFQSNRIELIEGGLVDGV